MNKRQIQNQQMILKVLGFYRGRCDGIWSKQTIKAKQEFERDKSFKPAYPNNGMPFDLSVTSKLPHGVTHDLRRRGMLAHEKLTQDKITEYSSDLVEAYDNRKETVAVPPQEKPEPTEQPEAPAEKPTIEPTVEESAPKKVVPHSHHSNHQRKNRNRGNK